MFTPRRIIAVALFTLAAITAGLADDADRAPQFPRVITGQVTDADGNPLAGALVEWGHFADGPDARESVETDVEGRYRLETSNVERDFRVGISKSGFAPSYVDGVIPGPAEKPTTLDFKMSDGTTITLHVTDRSGHPIPGLDVTPRTPSNGFVSSFSNPVQPTPLPGRDRTVTTDDEGRVTLVDLPVKPAEERKDRTPNPRNWLSVKLHLGDKLVHELQITEAQVIESNAIDVSIPNGRIPGSEARQDGMIRGRVVDRETSKPVTEYHVTLRYRPEPIDVNSRDGRFTFGGTLQNGRQYQTRIFADGYGVAIVPITADSPGKAVEQTIELERFPSLAGRLVDAATGAPLPGVQIVTGVAKENGFYYVEWEDLDSYADGHHGLENVLRVTTDEDGRFTAPEEPNRPATLVVLTPDYERRIIPPWKLPKAGDEGVLDIALQPAASATAIVLRETQIGAIANAVAISHESDDGFEHMYFPTPLDESGKLQFDSLAAGEYRLSLYLRLRTMSYPCYTKSFTLEPGEHKDVLLGDMPGTLRLHGTADPLALVQVRPTFPTEIGSFAIQADVDGNYELRDLFPGEYNVSVDNYRASSGFRVDGRSQTIELTDDMELMLASPLFNPESLRNQPQRSGQ